MLGRLLTSAAILLPSRAQARAARPLGLLIAPLLLSACSCNDQGFAPLTWSDIPDDYGKWLSMDKAPDGSPVIAYYDVTAGALGFAIGEIQQDGTVRWRHEQVDGWNSDQGMDTGDVGQYASMKVAKDGTIWLAYYGAGALRVAHRVDGAWTWEVADGGSGPSPDCGQWASLALDKDDNPVVAHYDSASGVLRVARLKDGSWSAETVWTGTDYDATLADGTTVHRKANGGKFARLYIDGDTEYVAFQDVAHQNLHLLSGFPGAYTDQVVADVADSTGNVGAWPSIWTDGTKLAIAYQDVANQDLDLAVRDGGGTFQISTVDAGEYVGADTELWADDAGKFSILYFDGRHNDMMLATQDETGWTTQDLGGDKAAVGFFNESIVTGGKRYVASYDYTNKHLFWRAI